MKKVSTISIVLAASAVILASCGKQETTKPTDHKHAADETEQPATETVQAETKSGTLAAGASLKLSENYIRKNTLTKAEMSFETFEVITLARGGDKVFYGYWIDITPSQVIAYRYTSSAETISTANHGLSISKDLTVTIDYKDGSEAAVTLTSGGKSKTVQVSWWGGGTPTLKNIGKSEMQATLSFTPKDCAYDLWIIGDSYIHWSYDARWPYYLYQKGYKKWMGDHLPGARSAQMYGCFNHDLSYGTPKYAIWAMGMNDGSDSSSVPASEWLTNVKKFIADCEKAGITPVLTTVPSIPSRDHSKKSKWVRESGYRYIDFSAAVTDNDGKQWHNGYLSSDNVHPASAGAKALADQVLKDFPEIKTL